MRRPFSLEKQCPHPTPLDSRFRVNLLFVRWFSSFSPHKSRPKHLIYPTELGLYERRRHSIRAQQKSSFLFSFAPFDRPTALFHDLSTGLPSLSNRACPQIPWPRFRDVAKHVTYWTIITVVATHAVSETLLRENECWGELSRDEDG